MSAVLPKPAVLMREALGNARAVALPTLPGLLLFAAAMGGQSWFNRLAADGSSCPGSCLPGPRPQDRPQSSC